MKDRHSFSHEREKKKWDLPRDHVQQNQTEDTHDDQHVREIHVVR